MNLPANRPVTAPAASTVQRRWWSRRKPVVVGPADSTEMDLGYESAHPWWLTQEAPAEAAALQIELPR
ncbi:hypothetical protein KGA65_05565 [Ideonella sp. B7]|uniref:hypothetical protein n=1 Tax=Ideonella benzenivorans TaxID=2831643 RepID=UPI001CED934E|nr:hypothetical protein [Ideonella benzenivorans]MCA6216011.1 hypothetical protein [Ideonella benzenivorans]